MVAEYFANPGKMFRKGWMLPNARKPITVHRENMFKYAKYPLHELLLNEHD